MEEAVGEEEEEGGEVGGGGEDIISNFLDHSIAICKSKKKITCNYFHSRNNSLMKNTYLEMQYLSNLSTVLCVLSDSEAG